ncbi:MAG: hypothetical protein OXT49_06000, partial [Gammaproteobacteria bacterium]|nr:hypothetical protein [Gammaproteobacteria bacterium]
SGNATELFLPFYRARQRECGMVIPCKRALTLPCEMAKTAQRVAQQGFQLFVALRLHGITMRHSARLNLKTLLHNSIVFPNQSFLNGRN